MKEKSHLYQKIVRLRFPDEIYEIYLPAFTVAFDIVLKSGNLFKFSFDNFATHRIAKSIAFDNLFLKKETKFYIQCYEKNEIALIRYYTSAPISRIGFVCGKNNITRSDYGFEDLHTLTTGIKSSIDYYGIFALSPSKLYACGSLGTFIISENGIHWKTIETGKSKTYYGVYAIDEKNVFLVGTTTGDTRNKGIIDKYDGTTLKTIAELTIDRAIRSITFMNRNLGIVCGDDNTIFRTEDGGNNWIPITIPPTYTSKIDFKDIYAVNEFTIYACGLGYNIEYDGGYRTNGGIVCKGTGTGGINWIQQNPRAISMSDRCANSICALSKMVLFVCGDMYSIRESNDAGMTWKVGEIVSDTIEHYNKIRFRKVYPHEADIYIVGSEGRILRYTGEKWAKQNNVNVPLYDIVITS